ncbi:MAG: RHS repeat domain-containing protein [Armatimonadota bacterium]|jgi:RHS repeat-associated protein
MAMSVTYATVHGRLVEENRGGVVTEYVPDTLGNVIMTTDESGTVTSTTTYWPFGEVRTQTGTNPSPWGFCGVWGYLTDAVSRMYVRARHYRADTSRWLTVDPLWPHQLPYAYAAGTPVTITDPSGLVVLVIPGIALGGLLTFLANLLLIAIGVLLAYLVFLGLKAFFQKLCGWIRWRMKNVCGDPDGRPNDVSAGQCCWNDSCLALFYKGQAYQRCADFRLAESLICYGSIDDKHLGPILDSLRLAAECRLIFALRCIGPPPFTGPRMPVFPIPSIPIPVPGIPPIFRPKVPNFG